MPQIGEIKRGDEVGFISRNRVIWIACEDCGKEFWVRVLWGKPRSLRCKTCYQKTPESRDNHSRAIRGERNYNWKGGRCKTRFGYIDVWVSPDDFFHPMTRGNSNRVFEHRLVMAKHLSRCLLPWEVVHHKNGIRDDNRIENLELISHNKYHVVDSKTKAYIHRLERKINELESLLKVAT